MIDYNLSSPFTSFFFYLLIAVLLPKSCCKNIVDVTLLFFFFKKSIIIRKNIKFIRIFVHRVPTKNESIQIITLSKYEKLKAFG